MGKHLKGGGCKHGLCHDQTCDASQQQNRAGLSSPRWDSCRKLGTQPKLHFCHGVSARCPVDEGVERKTEGEWELKGDMWTLLSCLMTQSLSATLL